MRYPTPQAFRAALDQRLKNEAASSGVALMRLRKRVAFERFLARMSATGSTGWMLKGAFALELRLGLRTRATKDIDLARADDEEAATEHLQAAAASDLGDFFAFDVRRTPALDTVTEVRAVRHTVRAELAGRRFEQFPVDVAIGEHSLSEVEWLPGPNLLAFAGIQAPDLPLIALDRHIAEKIHAYTRVYGPGGRRSTRVKDLIDIVLISDLTQLDAGRLRHALEDTFTRRAMQMLPEAVPAPPRSWARPYAEIAHQVGAAPSLDEGHAIVAALLDPILSLTTTSGTWDRDTKCWRTPTADG
ncbi:MAG: nucleotidyl transferase AbiEii/AbiGii toxin family protein [Acidimicrobiales bacterium]